MKNIFLQQDVPGEIVRLVNMIKEKKDLSTVIEEITIAADDLAYFAIGPDAIVAGTALEMYNIVDMNGYTGDRNRILDELYFLYALGLVVVRGTTYYMLPSAVDLLYGEEGFFQKFNPLDPPSNRDAALKPLEQYLLTKLLPGRLLRAKGAQEGVFTGLHSSRALARETREVESALQVLADEMSYRNGVPE
jgi:hypothetical protein